MSHTYCRDRMQCILGCSWLPTMATAQQPSRVCKSLCWWHYPAALLLLSLLEGIILSVSQSKSKQHNLFISSLHENTDTVRQQFCCIFFCTCTSSAAAFIWGLRTQCKTAFLLCWLFPCPFCLYLHILYPNSGVVQGCVRTDWRRLSRPLWERHIHL